MSCWIGILNKDSSVEAIYCSERSCHNVERMLLNYYSDKTQVRELVNHYITSYISQLNVSPKSTHYTNDLCGEQYRNIDDYIHKNNYIIFTKDGSFIDFLYHASAIYLYDPLYNKWRFIRYHNINCNWTELNEKTMERVVFEF